MLKYTYLFIVLVFFTSCKDEKVAEVVEETVAQEINIKKLPKRANVNTKANTILKKWPEYNALESSFNGLYKVNTKENLVVVIEDLIEKQKLLSASKYPEEFDKAQIKSRLNVFKTYILKTKGNIEYDLNVDEPLLEMVTAYNALRKQFNISVNYTLDTELILDEK